MLVVRELAGRDELDAEIDWLAVRDVLRAKRGMPVDVTRSTGEVAASR
jgi:hypothetical protein